MCPKLENILKLDSFCLYRVSSFTVSVVFGTVFINADANVELCYNFIDYRLLTQNYERSLPFYYGYDIKPLSIIVSDSF